MGKSIIITGCSQGMGFVTSQKFEKAGYTVFGIDLQESEYTQKVGTCDLRDLEQTRKKVTEIFTQYGAPDVLVNIAGVYFATTGQNQTVEEYEETMQVNARAIFFLSQLFGNQLIKEKKTGSIVNITSISGRIGSIDPAYAASKAAADALTKSFARSFAPYGIRVNGIGPGPINTSMADRIPEDRKKEYMKSILLNRFGEPSEIADVIFFLAHDTASFITGEIIYASGGIL